MSRHTEFVGLVFMTCLKKKKEREKKIWLFVLKLSDSAFVSPAPISEWRYAFQDILVKYCSNIFSLALAQGLWN